jgi:hypothetical protein
MKSISVLECYKKCYHSGMLIAVHDNNNEEEKKKKKARQVIYESYYAFYTNVEEANLARMVMASIEVGEQACLLYEEHVATRATPGDPLCGDDLEAIFEREIIPGHLSLKKLIKRQITECRHILRFRSVLCRDTLAPVICVRYYLVWRRPSETLFIG